MIILSNLDIFHNNPIVVEGIGLLLEAVPKNFSGHTKDTSGTSEGPIRIQCYSGRLTWTCRFSRDCRRVSRSL